MIAMIDLVALVVTSIGSTMEEAETVEMAAVMADGATEEVVLVDIVIETETMTVTVRDSLAEERAKMEKIKS